MKIRVANYEWLLLLWIVALFLVKFGVTAFYKVCKDKSLKLNKKNPSVPFPLAFLKPKLVIGPWRKKTILNEAIILVPSDFHDTLNPVAKLLEGCKEAGKWKQAMFCFKKLKADGVKVDIFCYNALILSLTRDEKFSEASTLLAEMKHSGPEPDTNTYNNILEGILKSKNIAEAKPLVLEVEGVSNCPIILSFYSKLIKNLVKADFVEDALNIFAMAKHKNIKPDITTYSDLMNGCLKQKKHPELIFLFCELRNQEIQPNTFVCNIVLSAHSEGTGGLARIQKFAQQMKDENIKADSMTYSILINSYITAKKIHRRKRTFE